MFLKSLTLRGFKSFADKTVLEFEPGVMVVVGPNGSGKSNLVDAVAWVLGAQGPRTLRGGKMDDVIFAGTPDRPALGRAEVALTIDNAAGLLPIEFSEVTITRTLFRNGDSEYAINNAPCRLLDIQELLSDTGIGRQQHVIVGQGQIDAVLNARPEDRRAVIEEAAGILKFRKRREKAERRLEATEGNLLRLHDLLREVKRGLGPLQRQADAARRHDGVVAELRAIRLHLAGHELAGLQAKAERLRYLAGELDTTGARVQARLRELDRQVLEAEQALSSVGHGDIADALGRVESMRERARGLQALLVEKRRGLELELSAAADEGVVETLVADAGALRNELVAAEREQASMSAQRAEVEDAERAVEHARHELEAESSDSAEAAQLARAVVDAEDHVVAADAAWREAVATASRRSARADALEQSMTAAVWDAGTDTLAELDGVAGKLVDLLDIEGGAELAVSAALGDALSAVVVDGDDAAREAFERLATGDAKAALLVLDRRDTAVTSGATLAPLGTRALASAVTARRSGLQAVVARLLGGVVLANADSWSAALDLAIENPDLTVVTRSGDRFGGSRPWALAGSGGTAVTQTEVDAARAEAEQAAEVCAAAEAGLFAARDQLRAAREQSQAADDAASRARAERHAALRARELAVASVRREFEVRAAASAERAAVLRQRLTQVEERLERDPEAKEAAERYRAEVAGRDGAYAAIESRLAGQLARIEDALTWLREARREQSERASAAGDRLDTLRRERSDLERELAGVRERQQRREIDDAENRVRLEASVERVRTDFDCEPAAALDAPAPEVEEGTTLAGRARDLDRELRMMGPINPLALEEYDQLQERHTFLTQQLDDVKNSRRELQRVIRAVDKEIIAVFGAAFADVEENFTQLFTTLFPGGAGRIYLTDPEDLLNTGIEMEARPSGKNTRRLSLLSGGERSLTAMAFLFAVFRARPSPFYLLDEVEAALDDVNLHRFLDLVHEFRDEAQLVIVSHQKRTMEAGDCLYGVSMPPGGSSRVVSQRMRGEIVLH
ncbi:MAG TPA: AAA family ATPase [Acidimicrobiia bacterium]